MLHLAFSDASPALPELLLAATAMALLVLGAWRGEGSTRLVSWLAVAAVAWATMWLTEAWIGRRNELG